MLLTSRYSSLAKLKTTKKNKKKQVQKLQRTYGQNKSNSKKTTETDLYSSTRPKNWKRKHTEQKTEKYTLQDKEAHVRNKASRSQKKF